MEANNMKAMREALTNLVDVIERYASNSPLWWHDGAKGVTPLKNAKAALAAPPRNCDVGTAVEHDARFGEFCVMRRTGSCAGCPDPVGGFTVATGVHECALVWAQMPYEAEEGGDK